MDIINGAIGFISSPIGLLTGVATAGLVGVAIDKISKAFWLQLFPKKYILDRVTRLNMRLENLKKKNPELVSQIEADLLELCENIKSIIKN